MLNTYPNANVQDFEPNRSYLEDRFKKNILQVQDVRTPIEEHPQKKLSLRKNFKYLESQQSKQGV